MANLEVFKHTYTTATHSSHARAGGTKSVDTASQCKGAAVCHSVMRHVLITLLCTSLHWGTAEKTHAPSDTLHHQLPFPRRRFRNCCC